MDSPEFYVITQVAALTGRHTEPEQFWTGKEWTSNDALARKYETYNDARGEARDLRVPSVDVEVIVSEVY